MFRRMLVPLDGTLESERAVAFASGLARCLRSEIRLLEVLPSPPEATAAKSAFLYLERIARELAWVNPRIDTQVRTGSTADGVLSCVELISAQLLVLTTALRDVEQIVFRARVPVVLVPRDAKGFTSIKRLLVPVHGSVGGRLTLAVAAELASQTGAELVLFRVAAPRQCQGDCLAGVPLRESPRPDGDTGSKAVAQLRMNGFIRHVEDDRRTGWRLPADGDFCEAIVEAARQVDADMVVAGTYEFFERLSLSFVDAAAVPVLLTPDALESKWGCPCLVDIPNESG